ncbi:MAG: type II toxin-antitoxin system HicB family antitoxin [Verrucomicrobia bacterium]|nr:type II toxin-antitoxin system HicB family antitoxin [Verrucomicrobiota bacterium]
MKYHFRIRKEKDGFSAQCIELIGCFTQGDNMKQLLTNMKEALALYVQEPEDSKDVAELPNEFIRKSRNIVEVVLDPKVAFAFFMRYRRLRQKR